MFKRLTARRLYKSFDVKGLMSLEFLRKIFEKYANTRFLKSPSSGNRTAACGRTDGQTYLMKLTVAFHNFTNEPKTETLCNSRVLLDKNLRSKIFISSYPSNGHTIDSWCFHQRVIRIVSSRRIHIITTAYLGGCHEKLVPRESRNLRAKSMAWTQSSERNWNFTIYPTSPD
jgi:hypothetical protein